MKVLLVNGSPKAKGNTAFALEQMAEVFTEQGIDAEIIHVGNQEIRGCVGCGTCAEHCPQKLPIPGYMEKISQIFPE